MSDLPLPRRRPALALILLLAQPGAATAQESPATACDAEPSTIAQDACLAAALRRADAGLNDAYGRALARIARDPAADQAAWTESLRASQRAWIAFRDADCGALILYEWHQGSGANPAALACRLDKTEARRRALVDRYTDR